MNYHCTKFYSNISTNMKTTNIFHFFLRFLAQNFYYFTPKLQILDLFSLEL